MERSIKQFFLTSWLRT